jgi:hypothetical protein
VAVAHDGTLLIALPYGERTDWVTNVLAKDSATLTTGGKTYQVDRSGIISIAEATSYSGPGSSACTGSSVSAPPFGSSTT